MPEKDKGTKKTITDELLEDNFFKPPIEDVLEEPPKEEVKPTKESIETEEKSDLLFEDFLKSPTELSQEATTEKITDATLSSSVEQLKSAPVTSPATPPSIRVATDVGGTGNKLKIIIGALSGVVALLIVGLVYVYLHSSKQKTEHVVVAGAERVVVKHPEEGTIKSTLTEQRHSEQPNKPQPQPQQPQVNNQVAEQPNAPLQPSNKQQVAVNVPPAVSPQPPTEITKQYEVLLEGIKSKIALNHAKRIGETTNNSLKFDITENKKSIPMYALFVDNIYHSEGEATADNLKLMVANISNASIIKADGGYRILIGKYDSKAKAMSKINDVKSAGLEGLVKETPNTIVTYDLKVYPFNSTKEAEAYQAKVKKLASKVTFMEVK